MDDDRALIAASAREFLAEQFGSRRLHAAYDGDLGIVADIWRGAVEMGWLSASLPERLGGLGLPASAAFAILKECGRRAVPGPILCASVAALWTADLGEGAELEACSAEIAGGDLRPSLPAFDWRASIEIVEDTASGRMAGAMGWSGDNAVLTPAIRDGRAVVALVETAEGTSRFDPDVIWDKTRRAGTLSLDGAKVRGLVADDDGRHAARLRTLLQLALAADSAGGAENAVEITVAYTKERRQFDRPVGSFQAVKHRIATMYLEAAQSGRLCQHAVDAYARGEADASLWALVAKAEATEVFARTAEESVLLHGGVGYTWEFDPHIFVKRAQFNLRAAGEPRDLRSQAWGLMTTAAEAGRSTAEIAA